MKLWESIKNFFGFKKSKWIVPYGITLAAPHTKEYRRIFANPMLKNNQKFLLRYYKKCGKQS